MKRIETVLKIVVVCFVVLLVCALLGEAGFRMLFKIKDAHYRKNPVMVRYGDVTVLSAYEGYEEAKVRKLLDETWYRPFAYESTTGFKEASFKGEYINVSEQGFRQNGTEAPWPPEKDAFTVFVFGGSTTFGYGVADDETIPAELEKLLSNPDKKTIVYNFGRGLYFSTQERLLFERLVAEGTSPDLAIFIDGLNEFEYKILSSPEGDAHIRAFASSLENRSFKDSLALTRLAVSISNRIHHMKRRGSPEEGAPVDNVRFNDEPLILAGIERYLANKALIETFANEHAIQTLFVWQPVPMYELLEGADPFLQGDFGEHPYSVFAYPLMEGLITNEPARFGTNFLSLAKIQKEEQGILYVDKVHYSAKLNRLIAEHIFDSLQTLP